MCIVHSTRGMKSPAAAAVWLFDFEHTVCIVSGQCAGCSFELHITVYQHKTVKAFEFMVQDLLYAVADVPLIRNPHARGTANAKALLTIREAVADAEAYAQLDDTVLSLIDNSPLITNEARRLLDRLKTRQHYRLCGKVQPHSPELSSASTF